MHNFCALGTNGLTKLVIPCVWKQMIQNLFLELLEWKKVKWENHIDNYQSYRLSNFWSENTENSPNDCQ